MRKQGGKEEEDWGKKKGIGGIGRKGREKKRGKKKKERMRNKGERDGTGKKENQEEECGR